MGVAAPTTGSGGVAVFVPGRVTNGVFTPLPAVALPTKTLDFIGKYDTTFPLELAVFTSSEDKVGVLSTAFNLNSNPKTITMSIDRNDNYSMRHMQRYCTSLRLEYESPASVGTDNAKQYEDGTEVNAEQTEDTSIKPDDVVFFAYVGPKVNDDLGGTVVFYGLVGIGSESANFTTAFKTDNQFQFTLTGAPQTAETTVDISDYVFNSAVGANFGKVGGANGVQLETAITDGKIGAIFGDFVFKIPKNTSIIEDIIPKQTI